MAFCGYECYRAFPAYRRCVNIFVYFTILTKYAILLYKFASLYYKEPIVLRCQLKYDDSELIQQTLDGDEQAFASLVDKYQKQIHALAWQKIGDFHLAQEITQDVFLTAFQKLSTLTFHHCFVGWLYVITNRKCIEWHRKKSPQPQSIETVDPGELEELYYSDYMTEQNEEAANQKRRTMVQKLLSKLQESERTVVTMYYIAEMSCEEIGKFLGVSPNTIRSRLHRARNKLKRDESMIKENLSSFQPPTQLTDNIMKKISQFDPTSPPNYKPFVPWVVSAASTILILLLMGIGAQNHVLFQQPYSLDAASESTIEIVDAQIILESPVKPEVKNQIGQTNISNTNNNTGQTPDNTSLASAQVDNDISNRKGLWTQTEGPEGGEVVNLYTTTNGDVYAGTYTGIYRLTDDKERWKLINSRNIFSHREQLSGMRSGPMVEKEGILYLATNREILISTDRGETWNTLSDHPGGRLIGLAMVDQTFYLCLKDEFHFSGENGVYRSEDNGATWLPLTPFEKKYPNIVPRAIAVVDNTVYVGTNKGLYRLNGAAWEQIFLDEIGEKAKYLPIISMEVTDDVLYVARSYHIANDFRGYINNGTPIHPTKDSWVELQEIPWSITREIDRARAATDLLWELFVSYDRGTTWEKITPRKNNTDRKELSITNLFKVNSEHKKDIQKMDTNSSYQSGIYSPLKIAVNENRVMLVDHRKHYYSVNSGKTWKTDDTNTVGNASAIVMVNEDTYYKSGYYGIYRTIDGGKSWHQFNTGLVNTEVWQLIAVDRTLYANTINGFVYSIDGGNSWTPVKGDTGYITRITESNGDIYVRDDKTGTPRFYRLLTNDYRLIAMSEIPILDKIDPWKENLELIRPDGDMGRNVSHGDGHFSELHLGGIAVANGTFYAEYSYQLYRWKPGNTQWLNTGLLDKGAIEDRSFCFANNIFIDAIGFRFAVSGNTVYVGEKEGQLMQSLDGGLTWNNVTKYLPFYVEHFKAIVLTGNFVYVATDYGVIMSGNGTEWHILKDIDGHLVIANILTTDGTTVYGEAGQKIYQLTRDKHTWVQVTPKISHIITCIDIEDNTIYIGTRNRGVFSFSLAE